MADAFQRLIELARQFDSTVEGKIAAEFGAFTSSFRQNIRNSLAQNLQLSQAERLKIGELSTRPDLKNWSVSISHCQQLGGWMASRNSDIGFDVEAADRIQREILTRICTPAELKSAEHNPALWSAKEAYFKSLRAKSQPQVITALTIVNWRAIGQSEWLWEGRGAAPTAGIAIRSETHIFCCCLNQRTYKRS